MSPLSYIECKILLQLKSKVYIHFYILFYVMDMYTMTVLLLMFFLVTELMCTRTHSKFKTCAYFFFLVKDIVEILKSSKLP